MQCRTVYGPQARHICTIRRDGRLDRHLEELLAFERGVHRDDQGPAIAWFKDPAGNFVSVLSDLQDRAG